MARTGKLRAGERPCNVARRGCVCWRGPAPPCVIARVARVVPLRPAAATLQSRAARHAAAAGNEFQSRHGIRRVVHAPSRCLCRRGQKCDRSPIRDPNRRYNCVDGPLVGIGTGTGDRMLLVRLSSSDSARSCVRTASPADRDCLIHCLDDCSDGKFRSLARYF